MKSLEKYIALFRIRDPELPFLSRDPGWVKIRIRIRDEKNLGPGWKKFGSGIRDGKNSAPGWKEFGSGIRDGKNSDPGWKEFGSGIRDGKKFGSGIRDKHPGSATLVESCMVSCRDRNVE
jgi:hypothetical protein